MMTHTELVLAFKELLAHPMPFGDYVISQGMVEAALAALEAEPLAVAVTKATCYGAQGDTQYFQVDSYITFTAEGREDRFPVRVAIYDHA